MLVLGIDPGSRAAGYGLVAADGNRLTAIDYGVVKPPPTKESSPRLKWIFNEFSKIVNEHGPDEIADLPLHEYSALEVKKALTGSGRAEKSQVADMVCRLLALKETPKPDDVTDSLAVAICHIHSSARIRRIAAG